MCDNRNTSTPKLSAKNRRLSFGISITPILPNHQNSYSMKPSAPYEDEENDVAEDSLIFAKESRAESSIHISEADSFMSVKEEDDNIEIVEDSFMGGKESSDGDGIDIADDSSRSIEESEDASVCIVEDSFIDDKSPKNRTIYLMDDSTADGKENLGNISRDRSLIETPPVNKLRNGSIFTPQTRKEREMRFQRRKSSLDDIILSDDDAKPIKPKPKIKPCDDESDDEVFVVEHKRKINPIINDNNGDVEIINPQPSKKIASIFNNRKVIEPQTVIKPIPASLKEFNEEKLITKVTAVRKEAVISDEKIKSLNNAIQTQPENIPTETPDGIVVDLMLHQKHGLTWMKWREDQDPRGGILADDMGLGKTLSMIALMVEQKNERKKSDELKKSLKKAMLECFQDEDDVVGAFATLVIAPASVIYQWEKEIKDRVQPGKMKVHVFHGNKRETDYRVLARNDVVITTYNIIGSELGIEKPLGYESDEEESDGGEFFHKQKSSKKVISKDNRKSVLTRIGWERIILDEAHNIKNRRSLTSKGCCSLHGLKRWALTGTPIHNNLWDFFSLIKFLQYHPFANEGWWKINMLLNNKNATEKLNTLVKCVLLRRIKNQNCPVTLKPLIELKPRTFEVINIQLEGMEERIYQHMFEASKQKVKEFMDENGKSRRGRGQVMMKNPFIGGKKEVDLNSKFQTMSCILVLLLRLRQACVHMCLTRQAVDLDAFKVDGGEIEDAVDELEKTLGNLSLEGEKLMQNEEKDISKIFEPTFVSAKMKTLFEKLDHVLECGDKCVIISQWTSMLDLVETHLLKRKVKMTSINGKILTKDRQERIDSFNKKNGGAQIMLLSLTAGGVGLNLVGGNHLFLLDLHWNPALEQQACDRIYRMGQQKHVFIHKLVCTDTIEQKVLALQEQKTTLASSVLEGAAKNSKLSYNDLKFLFGINSNAGPSKIPKAPYKGPANVRHNF